MEMDRRNVFAALSALGALGMLAEAGEPVLAKSRVIAFDQLQPIKLPTGSTMRRVMAGPLPTGEFVEIHESELPAGLMPHPPHKHPNTEVLFIQSGSLEYLDGDTAIPVGPGGIVFSASNVLHGLRNVGTTPATYIVVSVGRQSPE